MLTLQLVECAPSFAAIVEKPMHKMIEFLAVVVVCTVIGVACEQFEVNRYLKWLLMALPAIVWVRLRNPFLR
jgi:hypothetical protein